MRRVWAFCQRSETALSLASLNVTETTFDSLQGAACCPTKSSSAFFPPHPRYNPGREVTHGPLLPLRRRAQSSREPRAASDCHSGRLLIAHCCLVSLDHRIAADPDGVRAGMAWPSDRGKQACVPHESCARLRRAGLDGEEDLRQEPSCGGQLSQEGD